MGLNLTHTGFFLNRQFPEQGNKSLSSLYNNYPQWSNGFTS